MKAFVFVFLFAQILLPSRIGGVMNGSLQTYELPFFECSTFALALFVGVMVKWHESIVKGTSFFQQAKRPKATLSLPTSKYDEDLPRNLPE